ncbi:alpha/beta fold hydrolase [Pseudomonas syringae]|uniref:alpha/beta fold hydrolase n=1 Tax=Pseudomonas syringae TaxID=317 RepID=UPI00294ABD86|nr:alpha/beta fold hydrolase [Pseudomonas syringae]WOK29767.1 alpha/beta fold hydrolase [Pseudomonas syringae pv. actinidiae]
MLQALGDRPLVLIGSSLGGCVAALYAARQRQPVKGLVLLAPAGLGEAALGPALAHGLSTGEPCFGYRNEEEMERFWRLVFEQPPTVGRRLARALAASGARRYGQVQQVVDDFRREGLGQLVEQLPKVNCPVQVIWGRCDQVFLSSALSRRCFACCPTLRGTSSRELDMWHTWSAAPRWSRLSGGTCQGLHPSARKLPD